MKSKNPASETARKADVFSLKEALNQLLDVYKIRGKYNETFLVASWGRIMGATIANRTEKIYINQQKLYVKMNSAPLKNELVMSKSKIIEILNREAGSEVVSDVIFL